MENEEHRQIDAEHNNGGDGRVCTAQKTLENDRARLYDLYHMYAGKLISVCLFISTYYFCLFIYFYIIIFICLLIYLFMYILYLNWVFLLVYIYLHI